MGKKKDARKAEKKRLQALENRNFQEKVYDAVIDGRQMNQSIHWLLIALASSLFAVNIVKASEMIEMVSK